ncbi:flagellar basal body rod protein FlgB [Anaerocolumna xylanovorans]|uniref:Flagellar basal body rod protein FlgB n=1 Tax=Anaerocolumna xylanovorans DSM 12503 TaxID=1121345 RepID=A0A1M7YB91_9FIRM|nr:flagellar basal body rod protein FlgB [Anaerocolumna xylanovorans]SHO49895.1 flagellar basal-body rod protein FlgB [Anaerocolumna xylanovorans DSM 12503]
MINSDLFNYVNILNKAADATWTRGKLLTNNLANVSTPGYKRQDIEFQTYLAGALQQGSGTLDRKVAGVDLQSIEPTIYTDNSSLSYRLDGNNVDIDTESANFAENQITHDALLDAMTQEFSRIRIALSNS